MQTIYTYIITSGSLLHFHNERDNNLNICFHSELPFHFRHARRNKPKSRQTAMFPLLGHELQVSLGTWHTFTYQITHARTYKAHTKHTHTHTHTQSTQSTQSTHTKHTKHTRSRQNTFAFLFFNSSFIILTCPPKKTCEWKCSL